MAMPGDLGHPMQMRVIELADLGDPLHERREGLELRPVVIHRAQRALYID